MAERSVVSVFFIDLIVVLSVGGYLRQVSDGYDLSFLVAHLSHHQCHFLCHLTADTRIYLVKYDGGQFDGTGYESLDGEHHTCYLTS